MDFFLLHLICGVQQNLVSQFKDIADKSPGFSRIYPSINFHYLINFHRFVQYYMLHIQIRIL